MLRASMVTTRGPWRAHIASLRENPKVFDGIKSVAGSVGPALGTHWLSDPTALGEYASACKIDALRRSEPFPAKRHNKSRCSQG